MGTERSYKLETAFKATYGSRADGPNVTFISEYDALPEIGHACGHNLIAEVGVTVLGTPAEEGGGGKVKMIDAGAFSEVDVAMMSHPFPVNGIKPNALAVEIIEAVYMGRASHAAGYPWEGINALDAAVTCYQGISCLRQQCKPDWRIHCVILEGGVKVNVIPERTKLHIAIRTPTDPEMNTLRGKIMNIVQSGALVTGCTVETSTITKYSSMLHNNTLADLYAGNLAIVQTESAPWDSGTPPGSTDMGDVSHVVPSIHPMFYIGGTAVNHTRNFTADCGNPKAQTFAIYQAKTLAMTGVDVLLNKGLMEKIQDEFQNSMKKEKDGEN
ncbi:P20D2-like protein [Mya arenaria]|uniref:P20D2-like protein n=1 Tax=Mya arenaria TaxID=6604 RepID=A0ABY7FXE4_MYAAR|nr:P20D2-like protein [Mya arenaria]